MFFFFFNLLRLNEQYVLIKLLFEKKRNKDFNF